MANIQTSLDVPTTVITSSNITTNIHPIVAAFHDDLTEVLTDNGDTTFSSIGHKTESAILELDYHMILDGLNKQKINHNKRYHYTYEPVVIQQKHQEILDEKFNTIITRISSLNIKEQRKMWIHMFCYLFYVRNIRGEGKRQRLLFYYLFEKMHIHYPKTVVMLVDNIPKFGCFVDLNILITNFRKKEDSGKEVVDAIVTYYITCLNNDFSQVSGKSINTLNEKEVNELNKSIIVMSIDEISSFMKGKTLSLAAKWFPRDKKKGSENHDLFIYQIFPNFCNKALKLSNPVLFTKRWNYYSKILRKVITILTQCLCVQEQMMCTKPDTPDVISRDWSAINPNHIPAVAANKYRKALLNQHLTKPLTPETEKTGNRSDREDRIICREKTITAVFNNKIKGANQDISKLSKLIMSYINYEYTDITISNNLTKDERSFIDQQWRDLVKLNKDSTDEKYKSTDELGNVIPIIDTSGSMKDFHILDIAIGLGLLATTISKMPGIMITFSDKPQKIIINLDNDIFDQFRQILSGPIGYNTNIDAVYILLLEMMVKHSVPNTNFSLLFLTDGQFDSGLVTVNGKQFNGAFITRIEKAFNDKGYILPRIIFWNLKGKTNNYMATDSMKGLQLVSGFSQTLMNQVFVGEFDKTLDITPWNSLKNSLQNDIFTSIIDKVIETEEGVFTMVN